MKKITFDFSTSSIQNAIKTLEAQKKVLTDTLVPKFLERCAQWIEDRANEILDISDIGYKVKSWITHSWHTANPTKSSIVLYNSSWKSAFVEFGVGIIGQTEQHPNASTANYEYNVDSPHKFGQGMWQFAVDDPSMLDIPQEAIITERYNDDGDLLIITQGTKGVWYLYNALVDFRSSGKAKEIWEQVCEEFWK
jgi:hypothetical protein